MTLHPSPLPCESAVLSPNGTLLATAHGWSQTAGEARIWDVKTGKARFVFREPRGVRSVAFSPDGKLLAAGDFSNLIKLHDVATGKLVTVLRGHTGGVNSLVFSKDGKRLASGAHDHPARGRDDA